MKVPRLNIKEESDMVSIEELNPFDVNCMRMGYNQYYDRLVQMVNSGEITTQEFDSRLEEIKIKYAMLFENGL